MSDTEPTTIDDSRRIAEPSISEASRSTESYEIRDAIKKIRDDGFLSLLKRVYSLTSHHAPYLSSVLKGKYIINTLKKEDITLLVDSLGEAHLVSFNEEDMLEIWMENLSGDDVVWDIGAGHGVYTTAASYISRRVIGFEPTPENLRKTKQTLSANNVEADIYNFALGHENTKAELRTETVGTATKTVFTEKGSVEVHRGDELDGIPDPDAIKIDVEGSEVEVIKGLDNLLGNIRFILLEVHGGRHDIASRGHDREELYHTIEERGFNVEIVNEVPGGNSHWVCKKE